MKKIIIIVILLIGSSAQLFSQTVKGEILSDTNNVTVIRLWGNSEDRGFAYGYLVGDKILAVLEGFMIPYFGANYQSAKDLLEEGVSFKIDSVYQDEARAVLDGMGAAGWDTSGYSYLDILVGNCWHDLAYWNFSKGKSGFLCSTFMNWNDATAGTDMDGYSVISRHYDGYWWGIMQACYDNAVIVIHIPCEADQQPWLSVGYAGEMGPSSGINLNRLSMFSNGMGDQAWVYDTTAGYEPIKFTFRKALESSDYNQDGECNMLDIRDAISSNPLGYSDGWIFSALGPSTAIYDSLIAMAAEVAPEPPYITFRTNSFPDSIPGDNLFAANSQIMCNNAYHFCWRYGNIAAAVNTVNGIGIGSEENWALMRDSANNGYANLMFMQYIPEWDQLKLCVYTDSAAYLTDPVIYDVNEFFNFPQTFIAEPETNNSQLQISPNPVYGKTNARYRIPDAGWVSIKDYDMKGLEINELVAAKQSQGEHQVQFDTSDLPAGIYLVQLQTGDYKAVTRFVKL